METLMKPLLKTKTTLALNEFALRNIPTTAFENKINVPFMRPELGEEEIGEVIETLRSGWLTTGAKVKLFERNFAEAVGAPFAVALNSCTAALHLAVEALGL